MTNVTRIPTPQELANLGAKLNKLLLKQYTTFSGRQGSGLDTSVSFALLHIANSVDDSARRDQLLALLRGKAAMTDAARKALKIRRWSPVIKAVPTYLDIVASENEPDLPSLVKQQSNKHKSVSPSWSTLMGDKIYAIAHFRGRGLDSELSALMLPFGKAVQVAYSAITGVVIDGQPSRTHHDYLHAFENTWAQVASSNVLDLNSGLHEFGMELLRP
jgi:hypothetical protein